MFWWDDPEYSEYTDTNNVRRNKRVTKEENRFESAASRGRNLKLYYYGKKLNLNEV